MSKSDCRKGLFPVCMAKPDNETDEADFIWAAGDSIGVAPNVGAQAYFVINEGEAGSNSATFSGGAWALKPGESSKYDYAAYYPLVGDFYLDRTKVPVDYRGQVYRPADENKKLTSLAPHDFMAAKPTQAESSSNVAFSFNHLGALVEVQFTPDMTGNITEVALSMQTADLPYRGSFDLTADKIAITYGDDDKTAMIPVTVENMSVTEGKSTSVFFMMPPVSIESQQTYLRVNYEDGSTKMYMINVDKDLQAGFWYTLTTESSSNGLVLEDNSVFAANLADAISKTGATRIKFVTSSPVTSETVLAEYETTSKAYAVQNGEWLEVHTFCPSIVAGTSASNMFMNFTTVKEIDFTGFDTSNVQSMNGMFSNCTALTSLDLSAFNTSNVTNMNSMFYECRALESITFGENFVTSSVLLMNAMFFRCSELTSLDLSTFDTSNVTGMNAMFSRCETLTSLDLSTFDTSNVTDMGAMFNKCASLESITFGEKFVTSIVEDMSNMFYSCSDLTSLDLSTFDFSSVTYSSDMLENLGSEENPITIYVKNDDDKKTIENDLLYYDNSYATVLVKGQE